MNANLDETMIGNCANHLWSEIEVLRPDLIITQGTHPRDTVVAHYSDLRPLVKVGDGARRAQIFGRDHLIVLTTPHPARQRGLKYRRGALGLGQGSMPPFLGRSYSTDACRPGLLSSAAPLQSPETPVSYHAQTVDLVWRAAGLPIWADIAHFEWAPPGAGKTGFSSFGFSRQGDNCALRGGSRRRNCNSQNCTSQDQRMAVGSILNRTRESKNSSGR